MTDDRLTAQWTDEDGGRYEVSGDPNLVTAFIAHQRFTQWMARVDAEIAGRTGGLTSGDLTDWGYWDAWHDELSPAEVADDVLNDNGFGDH